MTFRTCAAAGFGQFAPMKRFLTSLAAATALSLTLSAPSLAQTITKPIARPQPKLVVVISIDQFSTNLFVQHRPEFIGGLGKLASQGVVYRHQRQRLVRRHARQAGLLPGRRQRHPGA
jgi:hypothetical protein